MRSLTVCAGLAILSGFAWAEDTPWVTFHGDFSRTGRSRVDFPTCAFDVEWTFDLGAHTWKYDKGTSVWSASPVVAPANGRWMVIIGAYDHNLYGLDALTSEEVWRFTTGGPIGAAPSFANVGGKPVVFVAGSDRTLYAVNAETGEQIWNFETLPWAYTVRPAVAGCPVVAKSGDRTIVFATFFNADRRPVQNVERAELLALDAVSGELIWRKELTDHPVTAPTYLAFDGAGYLFVGSEDGCIYAVRARDGQVVWKEVMAHAVAAAACASWIGGTPVLIVSDRWGMVSCLNARTGASIWGHKTGHEVLSTAALGATRNGPAVFVGSSDRCIHALDAKSSIRAWRFPTGKYVTASPVLCNMVGKSAVICNSLDNRLYFLDAEKGTRVWEFTAGDMLWAYETRGSTSWSSPAVASIGDMAMVYYPAYDGKLYALKAVPKCTAPGAEEMPEYPFASTAAATPSPPPTAVLIIGLLLAVAGLATIVVAAWRARREGPAPSAQPRAT